MQATVSRYDTETGSGAVLTDSGVELPFTVDAVADTPVRLLRLGQRVRLTPPAPARPSPSPRSTSSPCSDRSCPTAVGPGAAPDTAKAGRPWSGVTGLRWWCCGAAVLKVSERLRASPEPSWRGPSWPAPSWQRLRRSWPGAFLATVLVAVTLAGAFLAGAFLATVLVAAALAGAFLAAVLVAAALAGAAFLAPERLPWWRSPASARPASAASSHRRQRPSAPHPRGTSAPPSSWHAWSHRSAGCGPCGHHARWPRRHRNR